MTLNHPCDRRLFYWGGGSSDQLYPPNPPAEFPCEYILLHCKWVEADFLAIYTMRYDKLAARAILPKLTCQTHFQLSKPRYI